jgi:hypothetical protein
MGRADSGDQQMNNRDQIKARIAKLLGLAENSAAAEGEIENAMRFARRLMDMHAVSEDEARQAMNSTDGSTKAAAVEMNRYRASCGTAKMHRWQSTLAGYLVELTGAQAYHTGAQTERSPVTGGVLFDDSGESRKTSGVMFYGEAEACRIAADMYADLCETIAAMGRIRFGGAYRGDGAAYCEGFVSGLYSILTEERREARSHLPAGMTADDVLRALPAGGSVADHADAPAVSAAIEIKRAALAKRTGQTARAWLHAEHGVRLGGSSSRTGSRAGSAGARASGRADGRSHGTPSTKRTARLA